MEAALASPEIQAEIPLKGVRKFIAKRLSGIWREAVHVTLQKEADITHYYANKKDLPYSLPDYLFHALVQTLQEDGFRAFNAHFEEETLKVFRPVNLGIATDHPKGLIVPVLHGCEQWDLATFAEKRKAAVQRAREWKHSPQELENGTFTVSNLGTMGIDFFTPILNPPQVAILGLGRVKFESSSRSWNEPPIPRAFLHLSLTIDHRALDGADAARFLSALEEKLKILVEPAGEKLLPFPRS